MLPHGEVVIDVAVVFVVLIPKSVPRLVRLCFAGDKSPAPAVDLFEVQNGIHLSNFLAVYPVRRIDAEVLQDVFIDLFNARIKYVSEVPEPFSYVPDRVRTVQLYDSGLTNPFLEMFGRSTRDSGLMADRNRSVNEAQQMYLMNSNEVNTWIHQNVQTKIRDLKKIQSKRPESFEKGARALAENLWLKFLSRRPTEAETRSFVEMLQSSDADDAVWFLVNSREFLCLH